MKKFSIIYFSVMTLVFIYCLSSIVFQRIAWKIADKSTHIVSKIIDSVTERKLHTCGNYIIHLKELNHDLPTMTWEEYRTREQRKLEMEIQIAESGYKLIKSLTKHGSEI